MLLNLNPSDTVPHCLFRCSVTSNSLIYLEFDRPFGRKRRNISYHAGLPDLRENYHPKVFRNSPKVAQLAVSSVDYCCNYTLMQLTQN